ncbi:hypothetical protein GCM10020220_090410 [Nonomuraea rubra]
MTAASAAGSSLRPVSSGPYPWTSCIHCASSSSTDAIAIDVISAVTTPAENGALRNSLSSSRGSSLRRHRTANQPSATTATTAATRAPGEVRPYLPKFLIA